MVVRPTGTSIDQADQLCNVIKEASPEVVQCSPNVSGMGVIKVRAKDGTFAIRWTRFVGVDPVIERQVTGLDELAKAPAQSDDWIIPGADLLAPRKPDDISELTLVTAGRTTGGPPVKTPTELAATVEFGLHQYDKEFAYVPRKMAAALVGLAPDQATEIRVRIRDPRNSVAVRATIQAALDKLDRGLRHFTVIRYQETSTLFRALRLQRALAALLLGCLFAAAGFAVIAICHMIVLQKTRDIGILRSVGLSRTGVMKVFVAYGVLSSLAGVALGIGLGVFILDHIDWVRQTLTVALGHDVFPESLYGMKEVPHEVDPWVLLTITGIALAVSLIGSLYPAWRAARLNTVESLRYE
jgi:lipoprotein-releasing system permease protein